MASLFNLHFSQTTHIKKGNERRKVLIKTPKRGREEEKKSRKKVNRLSGDKRNTSSLHIKTILSIMDVDKRNEGRGIAIEK